MANKSNILPLLVGAINEKEVYTNANINCNPDGSSRVKDIFSGMDFDVLFPSQEGTDKIVPLIGGAIVKIKLGDDLWKTLHPNTETKISSSYNRLVNKINTNLTAKTNNLKDFISESDNFVGAYSTSKIANLHIIINKFLEKTNFYNKNLQTLKIPTLRLSSLISSEILSHIDLTKEINKAKDMGIRFNGLSEVGSFKFIPIETIQEIYKIISTPGKSFSQNIALSGDSYGCLNNDLANIENNSDKDTLIAKSILNLFPILRIDEDFINGEDFQNTIGYYTVYKDSLYIKTPDLSGRDSSGFSSNIYGLGEDTEEALSFAFEMSVRSNYGAISFDYLAPANISIVDEDYDLPASSGGSVSVKILKEGISDGCKFYLSPINPDANARIDGVRNVRTSSAGVEFFTAPNLSVPYFKESSNNNKLNPVLPLTGLNTDSSILDCNGVAIGFPSYKQKDIDVLGEDVAKKLENFFKFSKIEYIADGQNKDEAKLNFNFTSKLKTFSLADFGIPLFIGSQGFVDSPSQYCGLLNRPDIFLGRRDGEKSYRKNDIKYFSDKIYASKDFFLSITPNIARKEQIPKFWLESSSENEKLDAEEDEEIYEIIFKGGKSDLFDIDDFRSRESTEFALYCVDKLGQVSRASGQNIVLNKPTSLLLSLTPNGFRDSGVILKSGVILEELKVELDGQPDGLRSVKVYDAKSEGTLLKDIDIKNINIFATGSGFRIGFLKPIEDIFGTINGRLWVSVNDSENRLEIFIADTSVNEINQLLDATPEKVEFKDVVGLKAQGFGGTIDSVPILLDGSNAQIRLKYNQKVFKEGSEIYAYLAVNSLNDDSLNYKILSEDIGYDWNLDNENGIKFTNQFGMKYHIPTNIEWKFGSSHFKRINNKKALLLFPGPSGNLNISRFNNFIGSNGFPPAYLVLSNKKIRGELGSEVYFDKNSYAIIPIGSSENGNEKPAFINPPHILAMIAKIPGDRAFSSFAVTTAPTNISEYFSEIRGIKKEDVINNNTVGPLITSDGLDRLSVIFTGSNVESGISRSYTTYIGSTKIKSKRAGKVIGLDKAKSLLLLNFKKIRNIKDVGWTNLTISKKDRRFKTSYDSTVYNRATIEFDCSGNTPDLNCKDNSIIKEVNLSGNQISILQSESVKNIFSKDNSGKIILSESSSIFPNINDYGLSQLPYLNTGFSINVQKDGNDISKLGRSYVYFRNPIKIYSDSDLYLKLFLSDTDTQKNTLGEFAVISTSGTTDVDVDLSGAKDGLDRIKEQAIPGKQAISSEIIALDDELSNLDEGGRSEEDISQEKNSLEEKLGAYNEKESKAIDAIKSADEAAASEEAARKALEGLDSDASPEAVVEAEAALATAQSAASKAVEEANDAVDAVNDALSLLASVSDKLSRVSMIASGTLEDTSDALSASKRADDFYGVDIKNVFIQKNTPIKTSNIISNGDKTKFKLFFNVRFDKAAAIKFNSPEIISIREGDVNGERILPENFNTIKVEEPKILFLETIGTNKNTKLEINRIRTATNIEKEVGIFKFLKVEIENLDKYFYVGKDQCLNIALTNSNINRIKLAGQVDNDLAIDIDPIWSKYIGGGDRIKQGSVGDLIDKTSANPLRFVNVKLDSANIAKELIQSFCDMSYHLTAELSLQLRNFKVLLVPIKVILCIVDVICALLHPVRLAFAIIRLFLCLYDLILLLPQLSVPAMLLSLILHTLELLLCVVLKVLSIVNAINEIITAIDVAFKEDNYPAVVALEETLNEHLFSFEADLHVLEPILTIFGLFFELLELVFAFPCQVGSDEDDPACIDPSMLAGIILGKVAPFGQISPDALLPLAQTYTTIEPGKSTLGNTPAAGADDGSNFSDIDILKETRENAGALVVPSNAGYGGNNLTGLVDSVTGEPVVIGNNGFFSGDSDNDGRLDNVDYTTLRINEGNNNFQASFGISFTKSTKKFNLSTGPDPSFVEFQFNERGLTNSLAFNSFLALFFKKKNIEIFQSLDSPPGFVVPNGGSLIINNGNVGFTSPVDGASDFNGTSFSGFYLNEKGGGTYQPKPLTAKIDIEERVVDSETGEETTVVSEVYKTFGNIPMIAIVDDEFNVYFVQEGDGGAGGIVVEEIDGVQCITSINAKMINYPSAPKKKFSREDREVYRTRQDIRPKSNRAKNASKVPETTDVPAGKAMVYQQANANWLINSHSGLDYDNDIELFNNEFGSITDTAADIYSDILNDLNIGSGDGVYSGTSYNAGGSDPGNPPFPNYGAYDWTNGSKKEQEDFGDAIDSVKVFDFPTLYFVDMRHIADDIAAACGSRPTELLLDQDVFTPGGQNDLNDLVEETRNCIQSFKDFFLSQREITPGVLEGIIPKIKNQLADGKIPETIDVDSVIAKYNDTRSCLETKVNESCKFVINPLNTSFKLLNDIDETPLTEYIDPERQNLANLINYDLIDELEFDTSLEGFPKITGAMEYASGIGDSAAVKVGEKALIRIIPRDCYDDALPVSLDLTDSITIDILEDNTGSAKLVEPEDGSGKVVKNNGEYTLAISASSTGTVKIKATICSVTIQAVTDRSIVPTLSFSAEVDCIDDAGTPSGETEDAFAPGALAKIDRVLTILFVSPSVVDIAGDQDAKLATSSPQVFGTNLEN